MSILVFIANDFEDDEIRRPLERLFEEGFSVDLAGAEARQLYFGRRRRETLMSDVAFEQVRPIAYDLLVLPGGATAEHVRMHPGAMALVRHFVSLGKPIAAIGEGIGLLNRVIREPLAVDGNLLLAAGLEELPQFVDALIGMAQRDQVLIRT